MVKISLILCNYITTCPALEIMLFGFLDFDINLYFLFAAYCILLFKFFINIIFDCFIPSKISCVIHLYYLNSFRSILFDLLCEIPFIVILYNHTSIYICSIVIVIIDVSIH